MSIVDFAVICAVNNGDFLDDEKRKGLFGFIISYIVIVYAGFIVVSYFTSSTLFAKLYKISDMVLDAFFL